MWKKIKNFLDEHNGLGVNLIKILLVIGALVFFIVYFVLISELDE